MRISDWSSDVCSSDLNQAAALAKLPGVRRVEPDRIMTASEAQSGATWGLDRVDQTALPLDDVYRYPDNGGQGVNVYIIDTGITAAHTEFTGRIEIGRASWRERVCKYVSISVVAVPLKKQISKKKKKRKL